VIEIVPDYRQFFVGGGADHFSREQLTNGSRQLLPGYSCTQCHSRRMIREHRSGCYVAGADVSGPPNGLMLSRVAAPPSGRATRSVAQSEARKRRANERRYVGSCNELGGAPPLSVAMRDNVSVATETLRDIFARVERRLERVEAAFRSLLASGKQEKQNALEDVIVHGCALTIVMQNCRSLLPEFDSWYAPHAEKMRTDAGMRRFYKMRSEILKEGRLAISPAAVVFTVGPPWYPEPPQNAIGFIPYDEETGKCGWIVRKLDGSEVKVLADLPDNVQVKEFLVFSPALGTMDDLQVETTANRYVSHLRGMVDELRVLVIRAS
jgi:DNA-directed RNA polymerase subunit RPC12/RpoP